MEINEIVRILSHYNQWRRDKNVPSKLEMEDPKVVGKAIDEAIRELNKIR